MDQPPPYQEHPPCMNTSESHPSSEISGDATTNTPSSPWGAAESFLSTTNDIHAHRKAWLCPHLGIDFNTTKDLFSKLPPSQILNLRDITAFCDRKFCNNKLSHHISIRPNALGKLSHQLTSTIALFSTPSTPDSHAIYNDILTPDRIATGLYGLDLPICPHLRLNKPFIISRFNPGCLRVARPANNPCTCSTSRHSTDALPTSEKNVPRICRNMGRCLACHDRGISTMFAIFVGQSKGENGQADTWLCFCLIRDLGSLDSAGESAWLTNTLASENFERTADTWQDWEQYICKFGNQWFDHSHIEKDTMRPAVTRPLTSELIPRKESRESPMDSLKNESRKRNKVNPRNAVRYLQRLAKSWRIG